MSTSLNVTLTASTQSVPGEGLASAADKFSLYYTPILVILGCGGNLSAVLVFQTSKLREQTSSLYLTVLALSDSAFLFHLAYSWLNDLDDDFILNTNGYFQLSVYMTYVTCELSAWCVVAFTVERFIAIVYPFHINIICSKGRARAIVITLIAASLVLNIPVTVLSLCDQNGNCSMRPGMENLAYAFNIFDTVISLAIPLVIIVTLNLWMFCKLRGYDDERRGLRQKQVSHRVTAMLLVTSSMFVLLNLPSSALRLAIYANLHKYMHKENLTMDTMDTMQTIADQLFNTNFGINFYLYCLSGKSFRSALRQSYSSIRGLRRTPTQRSTAAATEVTVGATNQAETKLL